MGKLHRFDCLILITTDWLTYFELLFRRIAPLAAICYSVSIFMKSCKHFIIKNTTNISNLTVLLSIIRLLGNCVKVAHSDLLMLCINEKSIKFQQDISNIYIFKRSWNIINMKSTTLQ